MNEHRQFEPLSVKRFERFYLDSIPLQSLSYLFCLLVIVIAPCMAAAAEGTTFLHGYTSVDLDHNVFAAERADDIHSDFIWLGGLSYAYGQELSDTDGYLIRGAAEVRRFAHFNTLSSVTLKTSLDYRWHLSNALLAPWFRAAAHGSYTKTQRSAIRDGWRLSLEPTIGMRLNYRIEAHLGYIYDHRSAPYGRTFDLSGHRVQAEIRYDFNSSTVLYAKAFQRHGQSATSGLIGPPNIDLLRRAVEADPAFGVGARSWRIKSITRSIELGTDIRINDKHIVNLGGFYSVTDGEGGIEWDKSGLFVLYSHTFF